MVAYSKHPPSRWKSLALAVLFITTSMAAKLLPWWALSFLGEKSIVRSTIAGLAALAAAVALTVLLRRRLPGYDSPSLILLPRISRSEGWLLLAGLCAGAVLFALVFGIATATGGIQVQWRSTSLAPFVGTSVAVLIATILNAAWEEYTFRGWPFSAGVRAFGPHSVSIGSGAIFGLAHLLNPQWTLAAIASTALAGLLICYAMLAFQNILVVIGLHVGWNDTQSVLTSTKFWTVTSHPNPWLSGGKYGLEASAAGIAVTATAAVVALIGFFRKRRQA